MRGAWECVTLSQFCTRCAGAGVIECAFTVPRSSTCRGRAPANNSDVMAMFRLVYSGERATEALVDDFSGLLPLLGNSPWDCMLGIVHAHIRAAEGLSMRAKEIC